MAAVSESFDVKIRVVFPFLTKSLPKDDSERIGATGTFNFSPPPQVDTAQGSSVNENRVKETPAEDRVTSLKGELEDLLAGFQRIQDTMKKRSEHIVLRYDPELTENEALANAESDLFGSATGRITYQMYEQIVEYQEKINKYISHMSIESQGGFSAGLAS